MSPLFLDHNFPEHPKIEGLSDKAFRLHITALCHCARNLTDGLVTENALKKVAASSNVPRPVLAAKELAKAKLWRPLKSGAWKINDYLEYNESSLQIKQKQAANRTRMREIRARERAPERADAQTPVQTANVRDEQAKQQATPLRTTEVFLKAEQAVVPVRSQDLDLIDKETLDKSDPVHRLLSVMRAPTKASEDTLRLFQAYLPEPAFDYVRGELETTANVRNEVGLAVKILRRLRAEGFGTRNGAAPGVDVARFTGCSSKRGTHGTTLIYDPLGTEHPPPGWTYPKPSREEIEHALANRRAS